MESKLANVSIVILRPTTLLIILSKSVHFNCSITVFFNFKYG